MGQLYFIVNPKKRQYLDPERFCDGAKLLEFGPSGCGTMLGLAVLLADGNGRGLGDLSSESPLVGSWAGDPVIVTGDYADDGKHVPEEDVTAYRTAVAADAAVVSYLQSKGMRIDEAVPNLYKVAARCYADISDDIILALCDAPYERKALLERGTEAAKRWKPPVPKVDPFALD